MAWSNKETFKLIELYQSEPAIWDPKHELHKDRKEINDAWTRIADTLHIPITELKKKKESLMAAFRFNHKKRLDSIRAGGDIFNPVWIYYDVMEKFLEDIYECSTTEGTSSALEQNADVSEKHREQETKSGNNRGNKMKYPRKKKHSILPPASDTSEMEIVNSFSIVNQSVVNQDDESEDECDLYARLLAMKLRRYPEIERLEIMYEIDGLLVKRRRQRNSDNNHEASPQNILIFKRSSSSTSSY